MSEPAKTTQNQELFTVTFASRDSGLTMVDNKIIDPNGSQTPMDKSYYSLQSDSTLIKGFNGNLFFRAAGNVSIDAQSQMHLTSHEMQTTATGGIAIANFGEETKVNGDMTDDSKSKNAEYHKHLYEITQKAQDTIKQTPAEEVPCPNCAQKRLVDDKSDNWNIILDAVKKALRNFPYWAAPFAVLSTLIKYIYVALLGQSTNLSLSQNKGCGPGCKAGIKKGLSQKLIAGQKAVEDEMQARAEKMNKLTASMPDSSASAKVHKDSEIWIWGDPTLSSVSPYIKMQDSYHNYPSNLAKSKSLPHISYVTTEGNCNHVIYQPPLNSPFGNLFMQIQNNWKVVTGNAGTDIMSSGEIQVKGGSVHINGSEGEVSVTSNNLTTIGGGNVLISADNGSGDTGLTVDAKHAYFRGALNVNGDCGVLGGLSVEGAAFLPHIICPTMEAKSTMQGDSKFVTEHANWGPIGLATNISNFEKDLIFKFLLQPDYLLTFAGITELIMEAINIILMAITIDLGIGLGTGLYVGGCVNAAGPGISWGVVYNYTHNHVVPPGEHSHTMDVPRGSYYKTLAGGGELRTIGNPAPVPAPTHGTFQSPGPHALHGGCGGGGLYSKTRNQTYGIDSEDAYNGGNFVTTTVQRNPDGSINPPPDLTFRRILDCGTNNIVDPVTGAVTVNPANTSNNGENCES